MASLHALDTSAIATVQGIGYITSFFYLTGGLAVLAATLLPGYTSDADLTGIRAIAALAICFGLLLLPFGRRLPDWFYYASTLTGTGLIAAVVLMSGSATMAAATAVLYGYVLLDSVIHFGWKGMLLQVVVVVGVAAWSLGRMGVPAAAILVMVAIGLGIGAICAWLARASSAARHDQLTKLLNRRGFEAEINAALAAASRHGGQLALAYFDVDSLEAINDSLGSHSGDQLLRSSAHKWSQHVGGRGKLGRWGGDEFALLLPGHGVGSAADLADELRDLMPAGVSASAGVATWQPGDTISTLVGRADIALYDAKQAGRDRTSVYGDPGRTASELEAAIAAGEMFLEFQPVVSLTDDSVSCFEALVRWEHPERGLVPPGEFIPQAERTGAIHALGRWTLDQACRVAAASNNGDEQVGVAVNVSIPELRDAGFVELVTATLARHRLGRCQLTVEVTEAVFDDDDTQVTTSLRRLRELGVRLAIDDFGSGYSSLRWLERFPVDVLKIDAAFVRSIAVPGQEAPVLEGIIGLARKLGLDVIVEGVETEVQLQVLRGIGAELVQGFLFARPAPPVAGRLPCHGAHWAVPREPARLAG